MPRKKSVTINKVEVESPDPDAFARSLAELYPVRRPMWAVVRYAGTFLLGALFGLMLGTGCAHAPDRAPRPQREVFQAINRAAVLVRVIDNEHEARGSGVVIGYHGKNPLVLTVAHLFNPKVEQAIFGMVDMGLAGAEGNPAVVLALDPEVDLALLELEHIDGPAYRSSIDLAPRPPVDFDTLYLLAWPDQAPRTAGLGVLSASGRKVHTGESSSTPGYQITAFCWPGSSGGPITNDQAELVGIIRATSHSGDVALQNVCWAVPWATIRTFLKAHGVVL